jgi:hypothetical protein
MGFLAKPIPPATPAGLAFELIGTDANLGQHLTVEVDDILPNDIVGLQVALCARWMEATQ